MKADRAEEKGQKEAGRRMLEAMLTATNATYQKFGFPPLLSGSGKLPPRGLVPAASPIAEPRPVGIPALPQPSPRNFLQMPCLSPRAAAVPGGPSLNIPVPRGMSNSAFTPRLPLTRCSSEPPPSLMPIVSAGPVPRPMRHDVSRERVSLPIRSASFQPAALHRSFSSSSFRSVSYIPPSVVSTASPLHQGSFRALSGPQASPVMTPRAPAFRTLTSTSSWPASSVTSPRLDAQQRSASPMQQVRTRSRALPSLGAAGLPLLSEAELPTVSRSLPGNTKTSGTPLSQRLREMRKASPVKSMSMYETGFGSPLASYKPYSMQEMVSPMKSQSMFETSPQRTRGMIPIESSRNTTSHIKAVSTSASVCDPASASGNGEALRLDVGNVISSMVEPPTTKASSSPVLGVTAGSAPTSRNMILTSSNISGKGFGSPIASFKSHSMRELSPPMKSQSMFETSPQSRRQMTPIKSFRSATSHIKAVSTSASGCDPASASRYRGALCFDAGNIGSSMFGPPRTATSSSPVLGATAGSAPTSSDIIFSSSNIATFKTYSMRELSPPMKSQSILAAPSQSRSGMTSIKSSLTTCAGSTCAGSAPASKEVIFKSSPRVLSPSRKCASMVEASSAVESGTAPFRSSGLLGITTNTMPIVSPPMALVTPAMSDQTLPFMMTSSQQTSKQTSPVVTPRMFEARTPATAEAAAVGGVVSAGESTLSGFLSSSASSALDPARATPQAVQPLSPSRSTFNDKDSSFKPMEKKAPRTGSVWASLFESTLRG